MRTRSRRTLRSGHTLVEMIIVVVIISVLIAITVGVGLQIYNSHNVRMTEGVLENLATATERYRLERGRWPWEEYTRQWEVELTRTTLGRGANRLERSPYFTAGSPYLQTVGRLSNAANTGGAYGRVFLPEQTAYLLIYDAWGAVDDGTPANRDDMLDRAMPLGPLSADPWVRQHGTGLRPHTGWDELSTEPGVVWAANSVTIESTTGTPINNAYPFSGIRAFLPGSTLSLANQNAPVFVSAGADRRFHTEADNVYSHCGQ